jgi:hypothetical protein
MLDGRFTRALRAACTYSTKVKSHLESHVESCHIRKETNQPFIKLLLKKFELYVYFK